MDVISYLHGERSLRFCPNSTAYFLNSSLEFIIWQEDDYLPYKFYLPYFKASIKNIKFLFSYGSESKLFLATLLIKLQSTQNYPELCWARNNIFKKSSKWSVFPSKGVSYKSDLRASKLKAVNPLDELNSRVIPINMNLCYYNDL